ncbi:MAG: hypothetical protein NC212_06755 [Staphylococcus sp.]|nr:hypothetical protein [Staphylococcus sp.]
MKGKSRLLMVLAALCPLGLWAQGIADIVSVLEKTGCYESKASFSVSLPQSEKDVVYTIDLSSAPTPSDRLSPCSYLTEWSLETPSGEVTGFSAYFDGHHYRYRNERLQEYHTEWDSIPFMKRGNSEGVQASAQFTDLYPAYIAREISKMSSDPAYALTVIPDVNFDGRKAVKVKSVMTVNDVTAIEKEFLFDAESYLPLRIETECNPGQITEQSMYVAYTYPSEMKCPELSENRLSAVYPEVFEKYRENNFRIENLAGTQLPTFSLPTTTGERYTYHRGDRFAVPTIIALLDPTTGFNPEIVTDLRGAVDALPTPADVIWVFNSTNIDGIEAIVPSIRPGEHLLMNGRSLIRDCGAASLPVIIMAGSNGNVKNVVLGFNKELRNIVLQTMALVN